MIDRRTIDKIMDAVNIVDVVGDFVNLRKAGVNYKGLCPFHDDKTPSFMVSPSKNICHCFACGEGGNAVNFLMKHEQITYPEALRWLAKKYSIEIEERELSEEEKREQGERESMFIVNEWAREYFHDVLLNDAEGVSIGKQYFRSRGIRDDIIEKFQLGYSPANRQALSSAAKRAGYKTEFLVKTGLCYERNDKPEAIVDRYAGRVIFPWLNVSGKTVAFGGRLLDSRTKGVAQKYVNSPDSDIYHKERELYGLFQAKRSITKEDTVYMVEGYTDVIAMHQAGIENVVANSGTALSVHQIHLLRRFTQNITLLYDGDDAGIHAAMRGTDMLLAEGMNVRVLLLPDGDDPDSFSRKHSAQELREYIAAHQQDFIAFKSRLTVENVADPIKRSEAINGIVKSISVIPDAILRATYLSDFAHRIGMKEQPLITSMNKFIGQQIDERKRESQRAEAQAQPEPAQAAAPQPARSADNQIEELIMREVIQHGEQIIYENVETDDGRTINLSVAQYIAFDLGQDGIELSNPLYNRVLSEAADRSADPSFKAETYFMQHPDVEISSLAARLAIDRHQLGKRFEVKLSRDGLRGVVEHLIMDLRLGIVEGQLRELQRELRQTAGDMKRTMELMAQFKDTKELRDELARRLGTDVVR